jgi:transformation/transcription domain-associated protein
VLLNFKPLKALTLQPEAQKLAHMEASENGEIFVGVSPNIKNRVAYSEFKALQVKVISHNKRRKLLVVTLTI